MTDEPITLEEVRRGVCWHCGKPLIDPDEGSFGIGRLIRKSAEDEDMAGLIVHRACEELEVG